MRALTAACIIALVALPSSQSLVAGTTANAQPQTTTKAAAAEQSVRAFLYASSANDAAEYQRLIIPEQGSASLLGIEMPVVRARPGEAFTMPNGEIVRADAQADTLVVVGMYGMVELAFQLKRIDGQWKVVPQRYFELLRATGAI